jgi:hypothetical protein
MIHLEIALHPNEFRTWAQENGLEITLETTLGPRKHFHLHLRPKDEKAGTLEYTFDGERAWICAHENRMKPWVEAIFKQFKENSENLRGNP